MYMLDRKYVWAYGYMVVTRHVAYCVQRVWKGIYQTLYVIGLLLCSVSEGILPFCGDACVF